MNIPRDKSGKAKPYQVRQVLEAIDKLADNDEEANPEAENTETEDDTHGKA